MVEVRRAYNSVSEIASSSSHGKLTFKHRILPSAELLNGFVIADALDVLHGSSLKTKNP